MVIKSKSKEMGAIMKNKYWIPIYIILQCTWGILQTFLGFVIFLLLIKRPHEFYNGSIKTKWNRHGGVSCGLFIFVTDENAGITTPETCNKLSVHEYGHTIQSIILGPLYPFVIGIPSVAWGNLPKFTKLREEKNIPYSACFSESWADRLGEKVTGMESIW